MFGFGSNELNTPLGQMIKTATDCLRLGPDWDKNIEICEAIYKSRDKADLAVKALRKRLQDQDKHTVYLTLILLDTCMKNCGVDFPSAFDKHLMDEVINIAKGSRGPKNSEEALKLIQQWGRAYESKQSSFPLFFHSFMALKSKGVSFPKEDETSINGYNKSTNERSNSISSPSRNSSMSAPMPAPMSAPSKGEDNLDEDDFIKLQKDLAIVMEKVRLCREVLLVSPGIDKDDALAELIGYLEACRDRLVDVIEAGTQGILGEDLFAYCLKVNDAVLKTLDAERSGTRIEVDDEPEKAGKTEKSSENLIELGTPKTPSKEKEIVAGINGSAAFPSSSAANNTSFFDPFGTATLTKPSVNPFDDPPAPQVNVSSNPVDEFDIFLNSTANPPVPPTTTATTSTASTIANTSSPMKDEDFDAFFASLNTK